MIFIFTLQDNGKWYEGTLQELFSNNYRKVYKIAYKRTFDRELARDATQEAFLKALSNIHMLKDKNKFSAWLCTIVINVCKDMIREKLVEKDKLIPIYDEEGNTKEYFIELREFNIPEQVYEDKEIRQKMKKYICEMPHDVRQIVILRTYDELSYMEISEMMQMNENTVKTKMHRAKKDLGEKLKDYTDIGEKGEH